MSCTGSACPGSAILTTTEIVRRRDGKVIGVTTQAQSRTRKQTITAGSVRFTVNVGRTATVTVRLNSTGRTLLTRFGRLPVRFSIALTPAGRAPTTIANRRLTIKAK